MKGAVLSVSEQRKPATLADVARLSGVSAMTVSRVLNGTSKVSEPTQIRVRRAMAQLRYRPNPLARGLAQGRSYTIGVVTFDTGHYGPSSTLLGIERATRQRGYGLTLAVTAHTDRSAVREAVLSMADRRVDGMVVITPFVGAIGALLDLGRDVPVVVAEAGKPSEATVVGIDQVFGARIATQHLLDLGHRTVHHVGGPPDWIEAGLRAQGWREALRTAHRSEPAPVEGDWTPAAGYHAGLQLADDPEVTAVFVANDQMALGVLHALHQKGVRVPNDISVVGFDDTPESLFYQPSLTTVRQDFAALGELAVESLDRMIATNEPIDPELRLIAPSLIVRASSGPIGPGARQA